MRAAHLGLLLRSLALRLSRSASQLGFTPPPAYLILGPLAALALVFMMAHPPIPHPPASPANADARAVDSWFASVSLKEISPQDYVLVSVEASDSVETALKVSPSIFAVLCCDARAISAHILRAPQCYVQCHWRFSDLFVDNREIHAPFLAGLLDDDYFCRKSLLGTSTRLR